MTQQLAWWVSVVLIVALGAVFVSVARSAGAPAETAVPERAAGVRRRAFWAFVGIAVVVSIVSLRRLPYRSHAESLALEQAVHVTGHQWSWEVDAPRIKAGQPVDFQATSADVTHGFALFDDRGHLLAQVQAMPGYLNHMHFTFSHAGTYTVRCLEYCGLLHHAMSGKLIVLPPDPGPSDPGDQP